MNIETIKRARAKMALEILKIDQTIEALKKMKEEFLMPKPSAENIRSIAADAVDNVKNVDQQTEALSDISSSKN